MADAALFEFLHTEMVAELWAHHSDPGPGGGGGVTGPMSASRQRRASKGPEGCPVTASRKLCPHQVRSPQGQKMSLCVLEGMGFRVGQALGERLPQETLAFREELDILKFLCKDLWVAVFQKQMDSLRTNHQVCCARPGPASRLPTAAPTGFFSVPRGPTSYRITASPSSSGWPRACSIWRKHPSSWPSPAAFCEAPSAPWASRAWSPPPWHPCPPVSSRW
ncbi:trafficking protein particle complex subunit 6A isoform X1 [Mustela lutreola]|uniref:trafficking protein particle complex subunit 6A isoform X1 n=1 Tax=Mustela lutreola TaxID=9666 RepID=UPI0027971F9A|nr:trafficking protein particle complex subunit 6A isoform X1 [Mustela lutreola]